eukprot:scaffold70920_cov69-Phaeocystis_antarctica.AAC.4
MADVRGTFDFSSLCLVVYETVLERYVGVRVRGPGTETPTSLILRGGEEAQASVVGCGRPQRRPSRGEGAAPLRRGKG